MKKNILFILALGVLAVMAFGMTGTGAWFTTSAEINGNTITTGSLDLGVDGGPLGVSMLQPGDSWKDMGWFCVTNQGNYEMKWRGWFYEINDPGGIQNYLRIRLTINPVGHEGTYGPSNLVLYEDIPFSDLISNTNTILLMDGETNADHFEPQDSVCYGLQAKLDSTAGNAQQNASFTAKLYLIGTQWIAPW